MREPYEKESAIHSAPSFAVVTAKCLLKRKHGYEWAGYRASKNFNRDADAVVKAEGSMIRSDNASSRSVLRAERVINRVGTAEERLKISQQIEEIRGQIRYGTETL